MMSCQLNTIFESWNRHEILISILVTISMIWLLRSSTEILTEIDTNLSEYTLKAATS